MVLMKIEVILKATQEIVSNLTKWTLQKKNEDLCILMFLNYNDNLSPLTRPNFNLKLELLVKK